MPIELSDVRVEFIAIAALEEERDSYKREAKRCQEDIDARYLALRRRVTAPAEQMEIGNVTPIMGERGQPMAGSE